MQTENGSLVLRLLPGRRLDRDALPRRFTGVTFIGPHQVRLDLAALGEGWRESLVCALVAIQPAVNSRPQA